MKTAEFTLMILEPDGRIDQESKTYEIIEGLEVAARFISLFDHDVHGRVARVLVNGFVLMTYDSVIDHFQAGRLSERQGDV